MQVDYLGGAGNISKGVIKWYKEWKATNKGYFIKVATAVGD